MADDTQRAYIAGLRMLARRELSERQLRERLARREHPPDAIDTAVTRLLDTRALDDTRVAHALARTEVHIKRHGRVRARRELERSGIESSLAQRALDEVFDALDPDALLDAALARRLRDGQTIDDDATFRRLYRFLLGQGFESDRVIRALKRRRHG
jgi:regulatory protein